MTNAYELWEAELFALVEMRRDMGLPLNSPLPKHLDEAKA